MTSIFHNDGIVARRTRSRSRLRPSASRSRQPSSPVLIGWSS